MPSDPNWDRWTKSSVMLNIDTWNAALPTPYFKFVEGQERKTNKTSSWIEVRMDGPSKQEYSKDFWKLSLDISIVCTCGVDSDLYHIDRIVGNVGGWFQPGICIFKLGVGPADDPSELLGTLQQIKISGENLLVRHYGQVGAKEKLIQASITARYFMDIP